ncbi:uncharacterized protein LOC125373249 [Haliotis rufescens]|uniref:uncharacterized protein LOC125373249 n=1 Tax=Haliotis rufescens TaxID=6454 RepID=UPI00201E76A9|nr:uncharacterized protein LOC125373249 [Haliotis rufescens]
MVKLYMDKAANHLCPVASNFAVVNTYLLIPDIPVYTVRKENGQGRTRTLHRNLLLPVSSLPRQDVTPPKPAPRTSVPRPTVVPRRSRRIQGQDPDYDEDEDDDFIVVSTPSQPSVSTSREDDRPTEVRVDEDRASTSSDQDVEEPADSVQEQDQESDVDQAEDQSSESATSDTASVPEDVTPAVQDQDLEPIRGCDNSVPQVAPRPVPAPRRSTRERRKPQWMQSGDYVMSAITDVPEDWRSRADYLLSLIGTGVVNDVTAKSMLLSLISGHDK